MRVRRNATNGGDNFCSVETCDVKRVSPPVSGCDRRKKVVKPGGCSSYETSVCQTVEVILSLTSKLNVELASLQTKMSKEPISTG